MKWLVSFSVQAFAFAAICVAVGCANDAPFLTPSNTFGALEEGRGAPIQTPTSAAPNGSARAGPDADTLSECHEGQVLAPQERCTYPGTSDDFWVDESGVGHFLFFSASVVINAQNASINNQPYEFSAKRQDDGNWIIETIGSPSDTVRVSDLFVAGGATATPAPAFVQVPLISNTPTPAPTTPATFPSPAPSSTPLVSPASTSTPEQVPSPTPSSTATPTDRTETIGASPSRTATPESLVTAKVDFPTAVSIPPSMSDPSPEKEELEKVKAHGTDQVVNVNDSVVVDVSHAFSEIVDDGFRRLRAIVANSDVGHASVDSYTGLLTLTGVKPGLTWVALQACNDRGCSRLGDTTLRLKVLPLPNRPPQAVDSIAEQKVRMGESISVHLSAAFWDLDGDPIVDYKLQFAGEELATGTVDSVRGIVGLQGLQVGTTAVSVIACDDEGCGPEEFSLKFDLEVLPPQNQPPAIIGAISDRAVHLGETISLDLSALFDDPEGDPIRDYGFSQTDKSVIVSKVEPYAGTVTLKGAEVGTSVITVDARDTESGSSSAGLTFEVTVAEPPRNPPRVVGAISDRTVRLGKSVEVSVKEAFEAPERYRIIRYDYLLREPEISTESAITRGGILTLEGSEEGKSWVSVRACSYVGCSDFSDLSFVLVVTDPDREPNGSPEVVGALLDRTLTVGETVALDVSTAFSDPDDDPIVDYKYELSNPQYAIGSSITDTGVLRLHGSHVGITTVYIKACDEKEGCSDPEDMHFKLTVVAPLAKNQRDSGNAQS